MTTVDPQRELFVLGLLRRKQFSAYALDKAMREHTPLYRSFKRGNLYAFVERLAGEGLVEPCSGPARRGPSKTKTLYRLTPKGERRFAELLHSVMIDVQAEHAEVETALVLLGQLERDRATAMLVERSQSIEAHERRLSRLLGDLRKRAGAAYLSAWHNIHRLRAERRYLREAIELLRNPKWEPQWVLDDGPISDASRAV